MTDMSVPPLQPDGADISMEGKFVDYFLFSV